MNQTSWLRDPIPFAPNAIAAPDAPLASTVDSWSGNPGPGRRATILKARQKGRASRLSLGSLVVPFLVWACGDDCFCTPSVASIQLKPDILYAAVEDEFRIQARLFNNDGTEIPEYFSIRPQWQVIPDGAMELVERDGHAAVFRLVSSGADPITVVAEAAPGVTETMKVFAVVASSTEDFVRAEHLGGSLPNVVIVDDVVSNWSGSTVVSFTRLAPVGALADPDPTDARTGGILLYSGSKEMTHAAAPWTSALEVGDFRDTPDPGPHFGHVTGRKISVPLTVYVNPSAEGAAWTGVLAEAVARIHVADAGRTFAANRAGISFDVTDVWFLEDPVTTCSDNPTGPARLARDPTVTRFVNFSEANVFYGELDLGTGETCTSKPTILMNKRSALPTTLAHELGHLLGHTSEMDDLGVHNLMKQGDSDKPQELRRSRLTFGQVCEMNWGSAAFLRGPPWRTTGSAPTQCPSLTWDIP